MLKLFVAVYLVIVAAALVNSQSDDCQQRPRVDPRSCCNITKSFDRTEFPECFTEEVAFGAGGNRGSNRQRRAAWGPWNGHGAHWEHHDHDRFHHGSHGFHGPSSYDGKRDEDSGFRGEQDRKSNFRYTDRTNEAAIRGSEQGGINYRGANIYDATADFRGDRRSLHDSTTPNKWFAAEGNMKAFTCQIECFLSKSKIMTNSVIDAKIANARLVGIFATVPVDIVGPAIQKCAEKVNTQKLTGKPEIPSPFRELAGTCDHTGGFFLMCIHHEIFLNCPANIWTPTNDCNALRDFIENCRPGKRAAPGPPPS